MGFLILLTLMISELLLLHQVSLENEVDKLHFSADNLTPTSNEFNFLTELALNASHESIFLSRIHNNQSASKLPIQIEETATTKFMRNLDFGKVRRTKRQAFEVKNGEYFHWQFNINVSKHKNESQPVSIEAIPKSKTDQKYLRMALYGEGNGPEQSYTGLQKAWNLAGALLRQMFSGGLDSSDIKNEVPGISVALDNGTQNFIVDPSENATADVSRRIPRQGRLFSWFPFGRGSTEENTTENPVVTGLTENINLSESMQTESSINAKSLEFNSEDTVQTIESITEFELNRSVSSISNDYTAEIEELCFELMNPKSARFGIRISEFLRSDNFESIENISQPLIDSSSNFSDVFTNVTEDFIVPTGAQDTTEVQDLATNGSLQNEGGVLGFIRGLLPSFVSGTSARQVQRNEEISVVFDHEIGENTSQAITSVECTNIFHSQLQKLQFSKPNLLDIMNDPELFAEEFANSKSSPRIKERELKFLSTLLQLRLRNLSMGSGHAEASSIAIEANTTNTISVEMFSDQGITPTITDFLADEITVTLQNDESQPTQSPTTFKHELTPTNLEQKFWNLNELGSGDNSEFDRSNDTPERAFWDTFLGSGDSRNIITEDKNVNSNATIECIDECGIVGIENFTEITNFNDGTFWGNGIGLGNGTEKEPEDLDSDSRIFGNVFDFGSGEERMLNQTESISVSTNGIQDRMFLGNIFDLGSGEGRALDSTESNTNEVHNGTLFEDLLNIGSGSRSLEVTHLPDNTTDNGNAVTNALSLDIFENVTNSFDYVECLDECDADNVPEIAFNFEENTSVSTVTDMKTLMEFSDLGFENVTLVTSELTPVDFECTENCSFDSENVKNSTQFPECNDCSVGPGVSTQLPSESSECDDCNFGIDFNTPIPNESESLECIGCTVEFTASTDLSIEPASRSFETEIIITDFSASESGSEFPLEKISSLSLQPTEIVSVSTESNPQINTFLDSGDGIFESTEQISFHPEDEVLATTYVPFAQDVAATTYSTSSEPSIWYVSETQDHRQLLSTPHVPKPRFCTSASQCNSTLNERCVSGETAAVCDCGRSFLRNPKTKKCEAQAALEASARFPNLIFLEEYKDPYSERYRTMADSATKTMWLLLGEDKALFETVADVKVKGMRNGSLIIDWSITLAANDNETVAELIQQVNADLKEALRDEQLLKKTPLKAQYAVLLSIKSAMDPCAYSELNYCSDEAVCTRDIDQVGGYRCTCKPGFTDLSKDVEKYPGEICQVVCPPNYCGKRGICSVDPDGEMQCLCSGWNFGDKCQISGIVVIASFSAANLFIIFVTLVIVCIYIVVRKKSGKKASRFAKNQDHDFSSLSPQLAQVIELHPSAETTKFAPISTPIDHDALPAIHIVPASVSDASISYDSSFDSTFNNTPSTVSPRTTWRPSLNIQNNANVC